MLPGRTVRVLADAACWGLGNDARAVSCILVLRTATVVPCCSAACSRVWDPRKAATTDYPITSYQPVYFVAESMRDAKARMRDYCDSLERGFLVSYDAATQTVTPDRAIVKGAYLVTLQK